MPEIYTIGHSVQTIESFINALTINGITLLADVRSIPASRWHPQFGRVRLEASLKEAGIEYLHLPQLGGRQAMSFKEYVGTDDFTKAIYQLEAEAGQKSTAFMCAEADPKDCHRLHIAQWLHGNGWRVVHILKGGETVIHPATKVDVQGGLF